MFDDIVIVFQSSPWLFFTTVLFLGLCVGSFLNVVAYRQPLMMERDWKLECHEYLEIEKQAMDDRLKTSKRSMPAEA